MIIDTEREIVEGDQARERSSDAISVVETIGNENTDYEVADLIHRRSTHHTDAITVEDCKKQR